MFLWSLECTLGRSDCFKGFDIFLLVVHCTVNQSLKDLSFCRSVKRMHHQKLAFPVIINYLHKNHRLSKKS